jgi:arylsulfatase A-like enzyme
MTKTPNLLFIFTDAQRADTIQTGRIRTPNLDRLAEQAVLFERAYCTAPLCTPSRSSLLTGHYAHITGCTHNNLVLSPETLTIAERLKGSSYHKGYFGKWHLGNELCCPRGFDEHRSIEDMYREHHSREEDRWRISDYSQWLIAQGKEPDKQMPDGYRYFTRTAACRFPVPLTKPMYLAGEVERFLRENKDRPFALYVSMLEPHKPFTGPYDDLYPPESIALPSNFDRLPDDALPVARTRREALRAKGFSGDDLSNVAGWRKLIAKYHGLVTLVDDAVGRMLGALEALGLEEATIVVFTSDHGEMMGSHGLVAKNLFYEEATRIPLLIRVPGMVPRRVSLPVSHIDLVPTLSEYLGLSGLDDLPGQSLRALIESGAGARSSVLSQLARSHMEGGKLAEGVSASAATTPNGRALWTDDGWKLNTYEDVPPELFDLREDADEMHNRARDSACTERLRRMRALLKEQLKRLRDPFSPCLKP